MDHERIERISTDLSVVLALGSGLLATLAFADGFLDWDLLDVSMERLAGFLLAELVLATLLSGLLSALGNLRRASRALERLADGRATRSGNEGAA